MKSLLLLTTALCLATSIVCEAADKGEAHPVYSQKMKSLDGKDVDLSKYKGKVLLIVNTASQCGATPQYAPLQDLHSKYKDKGLVVLGFPCNQFGKQEPGTAAEISEFCTQNYGVEFDMFSKIEVNGDQAAPLYKYLTSEKSGIDDQGKVRWNFEKFLVSRDGKVLARFRTSVSPDSDKVVTAIEKALK